MSYRIAAASSDGVQIDRHFGHAETFSIFEVEENGQGPALKARRAVSPPCQHGSHDAQAMQAVTAALADCRYVLAEAIGGGAAAALRARGITPLETEDTMPVAQAVQQVLVYERRQHLHRRQG
ncbi:MAG: hypothetical protein II145_06035 [Selenomonas sp.]|jgi:predicted Fe-Mo cluster-binding NifX family protein|nr:hypothetical protein [Selenomonas sp.]